MTPERKMLEAAARADDDGGMVALVMRCALAVAAGEPTVTISTNGKAPKEFPRGELLSVGTNGARNYAVDPIKVMAWIHKATCRRAAAAIGERMQGG